MPILIVDDFLDSRLVIETMLTRLDDSIQVVGADSAGDAFKLLETNSPESGKPNIDLILMDIDMPEMNGVEACRHIKAAPDINDIPIIMVTSYDDEHYLEEAFAAGAIDYITKPVNKVELGARVRSALALKREMDRRKLALAELERESLAKSQILGTVTHELKTPLAGIMGCVDRLLLHREKVGPLNDRQEKYLKYIEEDSKILRALIDDLLDISRIEAGQIELRPTELNLHTEMEQSVRSAESQLPEKRLPVSLNLCRGSNSIWADKLRFHQIVTNLISNAYKYSSSEATITVTAKESCGFVQIDVSDTGMGISETDLPRLFSKFFRADNSLTRKESGTGLGLYITRLLVEAQGGQIWVESELGVGSTFSFTSPLKKARITKYDHQL